MAYGEAGIRQSLKLLSPKYHAKIWECIVNQLVHSKVRIRSSFIASSGISASIGVLAYVRKRTERRSVMSRMSLTASSPDNWKLLTMENLKKNMAGFLAIAGLITFCAAAVVNAAGARDQTGQGGDMSGHGGPVEKKAGSGGGQKSGPAPEPEAYRKPGAEGSGYSGGTKPQREGASEKGITNEKSSQGDGTTDTSGMGTSGKDDSFSMSPRKKGSGAANSDRQGAGSSSDASGK